MENGLVEGINTSWCQFTLAKDLAEGKLSFPTSSNLFCNSFTFEPKDDLMWVVTEMIKEKVPLLQTPTSQPWS